MEFSFEQTFVRFVNKIHEIYPIEKKKHPEGHTILSETNPNYYGVRNSLTDSNSIFVVAEFFFWTIRIFGVFQVQRHGPTLYIWMFCGLFVPKQLHDECCFVCGESCWQTYASIRDVAKKKNMKQLWKIKGFRNQTSCEMSDVLIVRFSCFCLCSRLCLLCLCLCLYGWCSGGGVGKNLIEPSGCWFPPKFPSRFLELNNFNGWNEWVGESGTCCSSICSQVESVQDQRVSEVNLQVQGCALCVCVACWCVGVGVGVMLTPTPFQLTPTPFPVCYVQNTIRVKWCQCTRGRFDCSSVPTTPGPLDDVLHPRKHKPLIKCELGVRAVTPPHNNSSSCLPSCPTLAQAHPQSTNSSTMDATFTSTKLQPGNLATDRTAFRSMPMAHSLSSSRIALNDFCKPTPVAPSWWWLLLGGCPLPCWWTSRNFPPTYWCLFRHPNTQHWSKPGMIVLRRLPCHPHQTRTWLSASPQRRHVWVLQTEPNSAPSCHSTQFTTLVFTRSRLHQLPSGIIRSASQQPSPGRKVLPHECWHVLTMREQTAPPSLILATNTLSFSATSQKLPLTHARATSNWLHFSLSHIIRRRMRGCSPHTWHLQGTPLDWCWRECWTPCVLGQIFTDSTPESSGRFTAPWMVS